MPYRIHLQPVSTLLSLTLSLTELSLSQMLPANAGLQSLRPRRKHKFAVKLLSRCSLILILHQLLG